MSDLKKYDDFWVSDDVKKITKKINNLEHMMCSFIRFCFDFWYSKNSVYRSKSPSFNLMRDLLRGTGNWKNAPRGNPEALPKHNFKK